MLVVVTYLALRVQLLVLVPSMLMMSLGWGSVACYRTNFQCREKPLTC